MPQGGSGGRVKLPRDAAYSPETYGDLIDLEVHQSNSPEQD